MSTDTNQETPSKPKRGRPTEIKRDITKTSQSGLREGLTRATFIIREDTLDKLKERAYTDREKLKDLVTEALDYYLASEIDTVLDNYEAFLLKFNDETSKVNLKLVAKQALIDWHNRQTLELLDRLESLNGSHPDSYIATFIEAERNKLKEVK